MEDSETTYEGDDEPNDVENTQSGLKLSSSGRRIDSRDVRSRPVDEGERSPESGVGLMIRTLILPLNIEREMNAPSRL